MSNSMFCPAHESTRKQLVLTVGLLLSIELFITDMLKVVNIQLTGAPLLTELTEIIWYQ